MLYFISSSEHKIKEFKSALSPEIQFVSLKLDLVEIQSLNPREVLSHKLNEAKKHCKGKIIIEDTSLSLNALGGFPGPFIKFFFKAIGNKGLVELTKKMGSSKVQAKTIIGYFDTKKTYFFEGVTKGKIVPAKKNSGFGFDPIFLPIGETKTYSELTKKQKNLVSHRGKALKKFKEFYLKKRSQPKTKKGVKKKIPSLN